MVKSRQTAGKVLRFSGHAKGFIRVLPKGSEQVRTGMNRNVSFSLLGLIMLLCIGVAASSVYYQYTYAGLQSKYITANESLQKTMSDYQEKEQILDAVLRNLSISEEREEVLGEKYEEVETEKVGLQTDLAQANKAIEALERTKKSLERENKDLKSDLDSKRFEIADLESDIEGLEEDIDNLRDQVIGLNETPVA
jgi:peptidoglycan hydrolase CwlO-like protein